MATSLPRKFHGPEEPGGLQSIGVTIASAHGLVTEQGEAVDLVAICIYPYLECSLIARAC